MKGRCDGYRQELTAWAAGAEPEAHLEEHVAACASCAAELVGLRRHLGEVDSALAEWLRESAPGGDFVRAVTEAAGRRPRQRSASWWAIAAALIVAGIAGIVGLRGKAAHAVPWETAIEIAAWRSPTDVFLSEPSRSLERTPKFGDFYFNLEESTENER